MKRIHDEPFHAQAAQGAVIVTGPDSIDVAMTPPAALRSAERISTAAVEALIDGDTERPKISE